MSFLQGSGSKRRCSSLDVYFKDACLYRSLSLIFADGYSTESQSSVPKDRHPRERTHWERARPAEWMLPWPQGLRGPLVRAARPAVQEPCLRVVWTAALPLTEAARLATQAGPAAGRWDGCRPATIY